MIKKISRYTLWSIFLLSGLAIFLTSFLRFDYNFENFFPQDDVQTEYYKYFRTQFETDNDFIIVGLKNEKGIFNSEFLGQVDSLATVFEGLKHVRDIYTPTRIKVSKRDALIGQVFERPLLRWEDENKLEKDSAYIFSDKQFLGNLISEDGKSISIQIRHKEFLNKLACDTLAWNVADILEGSGFQEYHAVGRAIGQDYYVSLMQEELAIFVSISLLLVIIFLWFAFRSLWGIWVPVTVVLMSIIWNLAVMCLAGKQIDLMLTVLPTILFVVGMSDVVHILSRYFEELRAGTPKMDALKITFRQIGLATFLTSLTTAIGFLTLMTSSIKPIAEFGLYVAIGVFLAFILAFSLLPAVLVLNKTPRVVQKKRIFWNVQLHRGFLFMLRKRNFILILATVIAGICIWGISRVEINNFILEDLKDSDPLKKEFVFFEENFSGARPFELSLELEDDSSSIFDLEILTQIDQIDTYLKEEYGVGSLISPAVMIKQAYRVWKGGALDFYRIPRSQREIDRLVKYMSQSQASDFMSAYVNNSERLIRVSGMVKDLGSKIFLTKNEDFYHWSKNNVDRTKLKPVITGTATLIDLNNSYLASNMINGLIIAFLVIALIVGIMFKSLKMVLIGLIPNMFPLLIIGGIMGIFGIYLKVSTSVIFTIAFGIAVDDTIHFLSKFRLQLGQGKSMIYAIKRSFISTGKAIVVTSLILIAGFMTLIVSDFLGTFYIGLLISLTLIFAVISDLFLLPALLLLFYKPGHRMKKNDSPFS